jgi:TetR/AcrR family transcriptional regulator, acrAB operon repressor
MPRRTKAQALATRSSILDAAEQLFQAQGVSRTCLQQIAQAAGVTRGAVYWHFADKVALFEAMLERVLLPLEDAAGLAKPPADEPALPALRRHLIGLLERSVADTRARRVFEILSLKAEYVGEMGAARQRLLQARTQHLAWIEASLERAGLPPATRAVQALGLQALIDGLFQGWMIDPGAYDLVATGRNAVDAYLAGLVAAA